MSDRSVTSEAELQTELQTLLQQAHDGGIDVRGGWECLNGPERPDWEVVVTEVQKPGGSD